MKIESASGNGSGAIYDTLNNSAFVITNHHVVKFVNKADVKVVTRDSITYTYSGEVLGTDPVKNLAVVRICCGSFTKLPFGDASALVPGEDVVAIGYDLGISGEATVTRHVVSDIGYDLDFQSDIIRTEAAINSGNSGGPMLSMSGEILGIYTFRQEETDSNMPVVVDGFAISGTTVQQQITTLKTGQPEGETVVSLFESFGESLDWVAIFDDESKQWLVYAPNGNFSTEILLTLYPSGYSLASTLTHLVPGDIVWVEVTDNDVNFQGYSLYKGRNLISID